ncbi:pentatricopeptide repeat-containing protein At1g31790 [Andrographis paniculata]|uniref:pentatricopeptide repeat-containing protein At1g31790 n=1 Tax=Andrographis paniculata TaxID=175694 RepID=UPI0021E7F36B|nr:pentatricopeptide repeat-containing protein At1g31790 [Andrographis paniculata]
MDAPCSLRIKGCTVMEIPAPNPQISYKYLSHGATNPRVGINFPLHKPEYKPPKPARINAPPNRRLPKPITTSSDVLRLFDSLKLPISMDVYTSLIKECTELGDPVKAVELHHHIGRSGLRLDLPALNRMLLMFVSCGCFNRARQLFDQMFLRDFNSWAVVIAACVENGEHREALNLFLRMLIELNVESFADRRNDFPAAGILVCVLKACLYAPDVEFGFQLHGWISKMGYSRSVVLNSFLISFYGKLKCFDNAQSVFDHGDDRNTAVWTSSIVNFILDNDYDGAIGVFKAMAREGVRTNGYTFSTVLKACGRSRNITFGRQIHASATKLGLESNTFVQCALVNLYGNCGYVDDARRVFEAGRETRSVACCNAMLANYVRHGFCVEAIRVLYEMTSAGFSPVESVVTELRSVCGGGEFCGVDR